MKMSIEKNVRILFLVIVQLLISNVLFAQHEKKVPPLESVVCVGEKAGEKTDLTQWRGSKPTIYIYIQAEHWDRPIARLVRGLDVAVADKITDGGLVLVWLSNNEIERFREHLPRVQQSLKLSMTTYSTWPGDTFGPPAWAINRDDHVTVITANEGKIIARHAFRSTNEGDVNKILADFSARP